MKFSRIKEYDELLKFSSTPEGLLDIQKNIIRFIEFCKQKGLSYNTIHSYVTGLRHFYEYNDVTLRWKRINAHLPSKGKRIDDRAYTHEEIKKMIDIANLRDKAILLVMASSGPRIDAVPSLRIKDLVPTDYNDASIYEIRYYPLGNDEYRGYCTPEAKRAIDDYIRWRKQCGERITENSPVFRKEFNRRDDIEIATKGTEINRSRSAEGKGEGEVLILFPGLKFPIEKVDLIDFAKYLDRISEYDQVAVEGFYYSQIMDLPDKTYVNKSSLEEAFLLSSSGTSGSSFSKKVRIVGFSLLTTKEEIEAYYAEWGKRQAIVELEKANEYFEKLSKEREKIDKRELEKRREQRRIEQKKEQLELEEESIEKGERFQARVQLWEEDQKKYEQQQEQDQLEREQRDRKEQEEIEKAAVKGTIDKPFKPVKTNL
jgi:hypothetical protein